MREIYELNIVLKGHLFHFKMGKCSLGLLWAFVLRDHSLTGDSNIICQGYIHLCEIVANLII